MQQNTALKALLPWFFKSSENPEEHAHTLQKAARAMRLNN